ncbi:hypothetical protein OHA18_41385 [Kribbella sp. NBC_00709]|uniref:hypothetical protein n=1 Tax=Kribbella sp. NBC_00709 TaxID=2975972 RepID=UPI002E282260|nr:hypothetical protein [Kribbella sp. NBC_00709]
MREKVLSLLGGALVTCMVGGFAIAMDGPPLLACAAAAAFVALGSVLPARGLARLIVQRQRKPLDVAGVAFLFAFLGVWLVWASTMALDASTSWLRFTGWVVLAWFSAMGASFVAALRHADDLRAVRTDDRPTRSR